MQINLSLKSILVFLWILFSIGYIVWDQYVEIRVKIANMSYTQGQTQVVESIMAEVKKVWCEKPITINYWQEKVELINMDCLKQQSNTNQANPTTNSTNVPTTWQNNP